MMLTYLGAWEKEGHRKNMCCIAQCPEVAMTSLNKASSEQLQSALETAGLMCFTSEIPIPTPLCKHHYHLIYNLVQPTQTHCVTCGTSLKHSSPKVCPQPKVVEKHLRENTDYDGHINDHDKVCYACYRAHLVILKRDDNITSTDSHLQELIINLSQQIPSNVHSVKEAIDASMKRVVVDVGTELMSGNALLLPTVRELLCQYVTEILRANNLESKDITQYIQVDTEQLNCYSAGPESELADIVIDEEVSKDGRDEDVEDIMDWVFANEAEAQAEQETQEHSEQAEDSEFFT